MIGPNTGPDACDRAMASAGIAENSASQVRAFRKGWNAHCADSHAQKREQRRYEAARAILAALSQVAEDESERPEVTARIAVARADALLAELERFK